MLLDPDAHERCNAEAQLGELSKNNHRKAQFLKAHWGLVRIHRVPQADKRPESGETDNEQPNPAGIDPEDKPLDVRPGGLHRDEHKDHEEQEQLCEYKGHFQQQDRPDIHHLLWDKPVPKSSV